MDSTEVDGVQPTKVEFTIVALTYKDLWAACIHLIQFLNAIFEVETKSSGLITNVVAITTLFHIEFLEQLVFQMYPSSRIPATFFLCIKRMFFSKIYLDLTSETMKCPLLIKLQYLIEILKKKMQPRVHIKNQNQMCPIVSLWLCVVEICFMLMHETVNLSLTGTRLQCNRIENRLRKVFKIWLRTTEYSLKAKFISWLAFNYNV